MSSRFFGTLFDHQLCVNVCLRLLTSALSPSVSLAQIYREFEHTVSSADKEKDLRWWSNNHGVNMPMNWPAFEVSDPRLYLSRARSRSFPGCASVRHAASVDTGGTRQFDRVPGCSCVQY